tara:strand:- start:377 stop:787 length:411 start_codon:yes stop_codon:yes gene_type:complete
MKRILLIIAAVVMLASCKEDATTNPTPSTTVTPTLLSIENDYVLRWEDGWGYETRNLSIIGASGSAIIGPNSVYFTVSDDPRFGGMELRNLRLEENLYLFDISGNEDGMPYGSFYDVDGTIKFQYGDKFIVGTPQR